MPPPVVTGELVSAITHDLRQPLTAVEMNVSAAIVFLERATPQIEEAIEALNDALGQQRRMRDALQVLQHLAMHGGAAPGRESIDVGAVDLVLASLQVVVGLAHLVVDSALLLDLLSRQSYSAAMARSSP